MPCPYSIILGRDTALPSPLYHSGATGFDITNNNSQLLIFQPDRSDNRPPINQQQQ